MRRVNHSIVSMMLLLDSVFAKSVSKSLHALPPCSHLIWPILGQMLDPQWELGEDHLEQLGVEPRGIGLNPFVYPTRQPYPCRAPRSIKRETYLEVHAISYLSLGYHVHNWMIEIQQ